MNGETQAPWMMFLLPMCLALALCPYGLDPSLIILFAVRSASLPATCLLVWRTRE